ncbi:MAG: exo-alpha-sialidase [Clostridiales bacterium]|nr:exo-alpha-sialidase [Clostridiales bacterium]
MKISFGEERLISKAPLGITGWRPWQFPTLFKDNNTLYLEFHIESDSASSYGKAKSTYISYNLGKTWSKTNIKGGISLIDGTKIRPHANPPFKASEVILPDPICEQTLYGNKLLAYPMEKIPNKFKKWFVSFFKDNKWSIEEVKVDIKGAVMYQITGLFPQPFFWHIKKALDNTLYVPSYKMTHINNKTSGYINALFLKSTDQGKSFSLISQINYKPPYEHDNQSKKRNGFTEPCICFINNKTAFTLLRTTDGLGIGPMYISWSNDQLKTWSEPKYFDDKGVFPQGITLDNGYTLVGYGRPGLHVKGYKNGEWSQRLDVVIPKDYQTDTCSYCALMPISKDKAIIIYSRFDYVDENKKTRKAIMCKEITIGDE